MLNKDQVSFFLFLDGWALFQQGVECTPRTTSWQPKDNVHECQVYCTIVNRGFGYTRLAFNKITKKCACCSGSASMKMNAQADVYEDRGMLFYLYIRTLR